MGREDSADNKLSYGSLIGALLLTAFAIAGQAISGLQTPYGESGYNINRLQMLSLGLNPYHMFDYCYGPLNLYMPWIFSQLRHGSIVAGYFFWWITEYLVGIAMLWFTVRQLPYALRWRTAIFWIITWLQLLNMPAQGVQYTPVRLLGTCVFLSWSPFMFRIDGNTRMLLLLLPACLLRSELGNFCGARYWRLRAACFAGLGC